jgi:hypothetical protein
MKVVRFSVLLAVLAAASVACVASASGATASKGKTIHVVEHAVTDAVTNGSAKKDKLGNVLTFANPVFNAANKQEVGTDQGYCIRTVVGRTWECNWTTFLNAGSITVEGPFSDEGNTVLSITGGTGSYATARGQMNLNYHNKKGTAFDFIFHLR